MIVKVCGMRDAVNIREVERAGADWMGFICYERSPRFIDRVPEYLPQKVVRVGVFVNAAPEVCLRQAEALALHAVQLHGTESPDCCDRLRKSGLKVVKAFAIHRAEELQITEPYARRMRLLPLRHSLPAIRRFGTLIRLEHLGTLSRQYAFSAERRDSSRKHGGTEGFPSSALGGHRPEQRL